MVIVSSVLGGIVGVLLLHFLLCSRFTPAALPVSQWIACLFGSFVLLCLDGHWALLIIAGCMAAGAMAHFLGRAPLRKALSFAALFGLLYAASYGVFGSLTAIFPGLDTVSTQLVRLTVLYALVSVAALLSPRWRTALVPSLQLLPIWLVSLLLCGLCIWASGTKGLPMLQFFSLLWLSYCGISLLPIANQIQKRLDAARQQQDARRQYAMQKEYYRQLQEKQVQTRALWHDIGKYLRAAKAETAPSDALDKLQTMLDDATAIIDVGNPVVNVILNEYAQSAKALGIELRLNVHIPGKLGISAADLYILVGNTMDNAMEACRSLPQHQRLIDLTMRLHLDVLYYRLANSFDPSKQKPQRDPMRGYGLENVRRCAEQYGGQLLTKQEQGFFTVSVHLNQRPESET